MRLKITLNSDLCIYSGETYNSFVDQDVVFDNYGLPYIPAKRIKGCLRESFLEMVDLGIVDESEYKLIFGREGNQNSKFTLANAYLEKYDDLVDDLRGIKDGVISSPQRVLELYSYVRTQTALNENGSADDKSLRTIRVVRKGLTFYADFNVSDELNSEMTKNLILAAKMIKHIGLSRTRGLGLVKIEVEEGENRPAVTLSNMEVPEGNARLWYTIKLDAPMLCKSSQGDQAKSMDYIEGAKILGMVAQKCGYETYKEKLSSIICSNAYIANEGKRSVPSMASLQKKKDQKYEDGVLLCKNMIVAKTSDEQMSPLGAKYIDKDGVVTEVSKEINYHHKRPNDKSIGRATGRDDSAFYQLESICKNQEFVGFIYGSKEQLDIIIEALKNSSEIRIGASKNVEYGLVSMNLDKAETLNSNCKSIQNEAYVKLNSSLIMYSENGMLSSDLKDLEFYLSKALFGCDGKVEIDSTSVCLNFDMIGGFNTTWHRKKPTGTILGKGSIVKVGFTEQATIPNDAVLFIGERNSEGFGEAEFIEELSETYSVKKKKEDKFEGSRKTDITKKLLEKQHIYDVEDDARTKAREIVATVKNDPAIDATLSKLIIITQRENTKADATKQIKDLADSLKKDLADSIFESAKNVPDEDYKIFVTAYLREIKYLIRPSKEERGSK